MVNNRTFSLRPWPHSQHGPEGKGDTKYVECEAKYTDIPSKLPKALSESFFRGIRMVLKVKTLQEEFEKCCFQEVLRKVQLAIGLIIFHQSICRISDANLAAILWFINILLILYSLEFS